MRTILLIEDDTNLSEALKATLSQQFNAETIAVESGEAALDVLQSREVDGVIVDLHLLGDMSGFDVIRWVRSNPATANLTVIAITANDTSQYQQSALEAGANHYDPKPLGGDFLNAVGQMVAA